MHSLKIIGLISFAFVVSFVTVGAGRASAGARSTPEVSISTSSKWAQGALGAARNSPDSAQYIGCSRTNSYVYCSARDVAGTWVHCDAYSAALAETVASLDSSAFVTFYWSGSSTSGTCSSISVSHFSLYPPKDP